MRGLPIACSLDASQMAERTERWQALAEHALISAEQTEGGVRQCYRGGVAIEAELRELVALEAECCPFLDLRVERAEAELRLEISGPPEAADIVAGFATSA
jgi:MerR family transcriptional regulator, copper efflux regulator